MSQAGKLKVLEEENGRLKRLLAGAMLDKIVLKEVAAKNWRGLPLGERPSSMLGSCSASASVEQSSPRFRRCEASLEMAAEGRTIFSVDRTSMCYAHRRSDDGDLRSQTREIAAGRRRVGYRRLGIMLARERLVMNYKKLLRLYREENLRVRRRRGRKRAMGTRAPMTLPQGPNQCATP